MYMTFKCDLSSFPAINLPFSETLTNKTTHFTYSFEEILTYL